MQSPQDQCTSNALQQALQDLRGGGGGVSRSRALEKAICKRPPKMVVPPCLA